MIKALGLPFQAVPSGGEGNLVAEYKAAVAKKEPIIMMFWEPHAMFADVTGKWVQFPKFEQAPKHVAVGASDAALAMQQIDRAFELLVPGKNRLPPTGIDTRQF